MNASTARPFGLFEMVFVFKVPFRSIRYSDSRCQDEIHSIVAVLNDCY